MTQEGIRQATLAKNYFKENGIEFDHAYSSTQERACDTLEIITDMEYVRLKGLKEWNFGTLEGESEDLNPKNKKGGTYGDFFVQYNGEEDLTVLAVSHGGACFMFLRKWEDLSKREKIHFTNCCILKFEFEDNEFKFIEVIDPLKNVV